MSKMLKWLTSVHPLYFLIFYIILIPLFAFFYFILPGHNFYAPYVRVEPAAEMDAKNVSNIVLSSILNHFSNDRMAKIPIDNGTTPVKFYGVDYYDMIPDFNMVRVYNMKSPGDGKLSFVLTFGYNGNRKRRDGANTQIFFNHVMEIDLQSKMVSSPPDDKRKTTMYFLGCDVSEYPPEERMGWIKLINSIFRRVGNEDAYPHIILDEHDDKILCDFVNGLNGDAVRISNSYLRMLYLSSITISTLGFGDIIPITSQSRLLVGVESFVGIVFIGLFINSVYARKNRLDSCISNEEDVGMD